MYQKVQLFRLCHGASDLRELFNLSEGVNPYPKVRLCQAVTTSIYSCACVSSMPSDKMLKTISLADNLELSRDFGLNRTVLE